MKSFRLFAAICTVALSAVATQAANAAATTYRITFTAREFLSDKANIPNAPVDPVKGSFYITLDPTVQGVVSGSGVPASLNIAGVPGGAISFEYSPGGRVRWGST